MVDPQAPSNIEVGEVDIGGEGGDTGAGSGGDASASRTRFEDVIGAVGDVASDPVGAVGDVGESARDVASDVGGGSGQPGEGAGDGGDTGGGSGGSTGSGGQIGGAGSIGRNVLDQARRGAERAERTAPKPSERQQQDLAETDQQFGPSGDETSGFQDPDRVEGGLQGVRFAGERQTVRDPLTGGQRTFRPGEALPTTGQRARFMETRLAARDPRLSRSDIAVRETADGDLETELTREGERGLERIRREQAAIRARRDLGVALSVSSDPTDTGPGGVNVDATQVNRGEDFEIVETESGYRPQLTDEFLAQRVRDQLDMPGFRQGQEFRIQRGEATQADVRAAQTVGDVAAGVGLGFGDEIDAATADLQPGPYSNVQLTPQGRSAITRTQVAEDIQPVQEQYPTLFGEEIRDVGQLQFDEEGQLVGAEAPEGGGPGEQFLEGGAAIGQTIAGPPGQLEREFGYAVSDPIGAATGPPGSIESAAGSLATDPAGAVLGAPGSVESAAGDVAYGIRDISAGAAGVVNQEVVEPTAPYVGEIAESVPLTTFVPGGVGGPSAEEIFGEGGDGYIGSDPSTPVGQAGERFAEYSGETFVESTAGLPAGAVDVGGLAAGGAEFTAEQVESQGVVEGLETSARAGFEFGRGAAEMTAEFAQEEPVGFAGVIGGGAIASIAGGPVIGRAASGVARRAGPRLRTLGGQGVDAEGLARRSVLSGRERFPGATDPELYQRYPAVAVRQQATEYTPDPILRQFERAGVTEGAPLTKALDVEPEGPGSGRAARGFRAVGDETGIDPDDIRPEMVQSFSDSPGPFAYENPGAFVSPELSPYFLGEIGESVSRGFSLRPGLPSLGRRPTVTIIRTEVDAPDAETQLGFAREMARREGETTARTKPAGSEAITPDEIEATLPAGAEFVDVGGSGPIRNTLRRLGIGADFYTEIRGERFPIRLAAPESEATGTTSPLRSLLSDESGQVGRGSPPVRRRISVESRPARQPVDRPFPGVDPATADSATSGRSPSEQADTDIGVSSTVAASEPVSEPSTPSAFEVNASGGASASGASSGGVGSGPAPSNPFSSGGSGSSGGGSGASQPPSTPPSRPPSVPGMPPISPPTSPPSPPETPPNQPPTRPPRVPDDDTSDDDEEFQPLAPTGQEFFNPVATGQAFLFGGDDGADGDVPDNPFF